MVAAENVALRDRQYALAISQGHAPPPPPTAQPTRRANTSEPLVKMGNCSSKADKDSIPIFVVASDEEEVTTMYVVLLFMFGENA